MSITSLLSKSKFGTPIKKVELVFKKKQQIFMEISQDFVNFGLATITAMNMRNLTWYLTDQGCLVCGGYDGGSTKLPNTKLHLIVDDNLPWLIKFANKTNWRDFGTPIRIFANAVDHIQCIKLLNELEERQTVSAAS